MNQWRQAIDNRWKDKYTILTGSWNDPVIRTGKIDKSAREGLTDEK